uniref:exosome complex exonuclease RRP44-like isoform X1 n=1 Tax=Styela clava TaxID=7725 RepID=UPI001939284E|nr:exosome complex exonuclease RRP44-like isoform X1 [Styela clava]
MLTSKVLMVKTRSGKILKIIREHYLRDDIKNGLELKDEKSMDEHPSLVNNLVNVEHILVVDTNVVLKQIDVLHHPAIKNVIVLQTVLREVRRRSSPVYKKLRTLIENPDKKFFVFTNEHSIDTWVERERGESSNDWNDRLIRTATSFYDKCLEERKQKAVLVTNDRANKDLAIKGGLLSFTMEEYVKNIVGFPELIDKLAKEADESIEVDKSISYPQHLPLSKLQMGIKHGKYRQGKINISRDNYLEGHIQMSGDDETSILIQGRINLNRAVHQDIVAVEILPEKEWSMPSDVVLDIEMQPGADTDAREKNVNNTNENQATKKRTGKVIGIIKRNWRPYCGILEDSGNKDMTRHLFSPADRRIPRVRVETRQAAKLVGQRIIVAIDSWGRFSKYPQGHFVRALGGVGEKDTENEVLLLEHDIPHEPFSKAVLKCLPQPDWSIPETEIKKRKDLRYLPICSVDPPGCTDIDDCLHYRELENEPDLCEVGVHIADVSYFIRPGTALDEESKARGTTVYLCDKRIDMVPDVLSSNLCSLRDDGDRLAFSCIWKLNKNAEIVETSFCKSIIRSRKSLTYAEAQMMIDDKSMNDDVTIGLRGLNMLAKILKKRRIDNGALSLASPEVRFHIDSETHDPIDLQTKELKDTNSMVEEFMLLANCSVAKYTESEFPDCAILRKHPTPPQSNYDMLINAAKSRGVNIETDTSLDLARSLDDAHIPGNPYIQTLLRIIATRCMLQAVYFCSGMDSDYLHYGLAAPIYTHFTSPIRRYSDILAHRLLAAAIGDDMTFPALLDKHEQQRVCDNLNFRHRMAQYAQRASVALHTQLFFREKVVNEEGFIIAVKKNAVQVLIPKYGLEGTVFLDRTIDGTVVPADQMTYTEDECKIAIRGRIMQVFDAVTVEISHDKSNIQRQRIVMKLVSPTIAQISVPLLKAEENAAKRMKMDE